MLTIYIGRPDTNSISIETFCSQVRELQNNEAIAFGREISGVISDSQVIAEVEDLGARSVIEFEFVAEARVLITPLFDNWHSLPSVRLDRDGKPVRRSW